MVMRSCLLAWVVAVLVCSPTQASGVRPVELQTMVADSTHILLGRVAWLESRWNQDHTLIETDVHLEVERSLKGQERSTMVLTLPGGRVGDLVLAVHGAPRLAEEETVLVFARETRPGHLALRFLATGVHRVEGSGSKRWVQGDPVLLSRILSGRRAAPDASGRVSLESLASEIRGAVKASSGGAR